MPVETWRLQLIDLIGQLTLSEQEEDTLVRLINNTATLLDGYAVIISYAENQNDASVLDDASLLDLDN